MKRKLCALTIIFTLWVSRFALGQQEFAYFDVNPGMREALRTIKANDFRTENNVDGAGVKIAIIDTGLDVSHSDLQSTPQGRAKVIDFVDFTDEGLISTKLIAASKDNQLSIEGRKYGVKGIPSRSGVFHVGVFKETQLAEDSPLGRDINRNGKDSDIFGILVTDSVLPGIYDTVYVDTNLNFNFADEKPLKVYSRKFQWDIFGRDNPNTDYVEESSFVVSSIDLKGNWVKLGFDGNGHGTHVAGILGANGRLSGTAPGAQIIVIKALGSAGDGNWDDIAKAVEYAGKQGAHIINISIGNMASSREEQKAQLNLFKKISLQSNALIVVAAGNQGPGLATAYNAGNNESVITVGAYMSEALWNINYNAQVPGETLWFYSGMGPQDDGSMAPSVVAPSTVISTVNRWDSGGYFAMDGTSMAAPFVSGSAALVLQQARKDGLDISPWQLKRSFELSARKISGYHEFEQGYGLIDVSETWKMLKKQAFTPSKVAIKVPGISGYTQGSFLKDQLVGKQELNITNLSSNLQKLNIETNAPWIKAEKSEVLLPRGKPQSLILSYKIPEKPGVYTGKTVGYGEKSGDYAFEFTTTAVVPHDLKKSSNMNFNDTLGPSQWKRYFFKTSPGMSELRAELAVLDKDTGFSGRGLFYVYDPDGQKVFEGYAGSDYITPLANTVFKVDRPKPGIWEVVVVSDYNLSDFQVATTTYNLNVTALGVFTDVEHLAFSNPKENEHISREIMLKNGGRDFTGYLKGLGMAEIGEGIISADIVVKDREFVKGLIVKVPQDTMCLSVKTKSISLSQEDVDLYLYRKDTKTGLYEEVAFSAKVDTSNEMIQIIRPLPGDYVVYVDGYSVPQGSANIKLIGQILGDKQGLIVRNPAVNQKAGQEWKAILDIKRTGNGNHFIGFIAVENEKKVEISYIPVELSIGKRELDVTISDRDVFVQDKQTKLPVNTILMANGIAFPVKDGKVSLPENFTINTLEIYDDRYAPLYLEDAKKSQLFTYHFVLLRQLLENIASFLGKSQIKFLLEEIKVDKPAETINMLNSLSHKKVFIPQINEMNEKEKAVFNEVFDKLLIKYNFKF